MKRTQKSRSPVLRDCGFLLNRKILPTGCALRHKKQIPLCERRMRGFRKRNSIFMLLVQPSNKEQPVAYIL
nr:MAG TPA: hypothetical protein [Caudoviricetes sp.]